MGIAFLHGNSGGNALNFKVVGGTSAPTSPKENTLWVDTDAKITEWYFCAKEPNVYDVKLEESDDPWLLVSPHILQEGDILNFTIPARASTPREAIRIRDPYSNKEYCVRLHDGSIVTTWPAGVKVGVRISNDLNKIGSWGKQGTAYIIAWDSYYHEEGAVWIQTAASSAVEFNALKKNGIQVYPMSTKQYVNGTLVNKDCSIYRNGAWHSLNTYLFESGNQYIDSTGGWSSTHQNDNEWSYDGNDASNPEYGGGAWVGETLSVVIHTSTGTRCGVAAVGTRNKIDLTPYKKIKAVCNLDLANPCYIRLAINTTLKTPQGSPTAYVDIPAGASTVELDVSNISGLYHVIIGGMNKNSESIYGCGLTVSSVVLE